MTHDFEASLAWGESASEEQFWEAVYFRAFPGIVSLSRSGRDNVAQRVLGIDRYVHLSSGKTLAIDEKRRRKDWGDVLLEWMSDDVSGAPGWIEKDLQIDFLAYGFVESKRCLLFCWPMLRRAWLRFGDEWKQKAEQGADGFKVVVADNVGRSGGRYRTHGVAVPTSELLAAVKNAAIIDLSDWTRPASRASPATGRVA